MADTAAADLSFWRSLRRRKVVQWAFAYAAGAWGCLQVFEYATEAFGWPGELRRVALLAALVGLPIAIIVAWFHGERGRQRVTATELTMIVLLAAAGVLFSVAATSAWLLVRPGLTARAALSEARFSMLTDFEGAEQDVAISRDGTFAAFLADRDGAMDVWVTQVGTGEFRNLTAGRGPETQIQEVRAVQFSPDGSQVIFWGRTADPASGEAAIDLWSVPTLGGEPRRYLSGAAEVAWSNDGSRMAYHPPLPGDPLFVTEPGETEGRQIYVASPGTHCHFPVWSPDDEYIYFVRGQPGGDTDLWRIRPDGSGAEQVTSHHSRVSHPVFLDGRTMLYLATTDDGSGPWLHVLDVKSGESRRLSVGTDRYSSLAGSADGRRLLASVARPRASLWRLPLADPVADTAVPTRIQMPTTGGRSPRFARDYLLFVSSKRGQDGIWKLVGNSATELWSRPDTRLVGGPAVSPDGKYIAFTAERGGTGRLQVISADGADSRTLAAPLDARGTPDWSPDGRSIAVASSDGAILRLVRVPLDGGPATPLTEDYSIDPRWSPDGAFLVYSGPQVGPEARILAVESNGKRREIAAVTVMREARRVGFRAPAGELVVLSGALDHKDFWAVDLESGSRRRLSNIGREFSIGDFDVSADGREIVFDRRDETTDIVLIER